MYHFAKKPKAEQTYEWALKEMSSHSSYRLRDIAKRHLTEELIIAAICNWNASLSQIPEQLRTEKVCRAAVQAHGSGHSLKAVPENIRTFDFLLYAVSCHPNNFAAARYLLHKGENLDTYTEQDIALAKEAMCPRVYGCHMIASLREFGRKHRFRTESEYLSYITKNAPSATIPNNLVYQALCALEREWAIKPAGATE